MVAVRPAAVSALDLILLWPFRLHSHGDLLKVRESDQKAPAEWLAEAAKWIEKPGKAGVGLWKRVPDFYRAGEAADAGNPGARADQYAEFVYFHPFVRNEIYAEAPSMAVLERDDIKGMTAVIPIGEKSSFTARFAVQFCRLMLFPSDVGVLSLHLRLQSIQRMLDYGQQETTSDASLHETEAILDRVRRTYAPFYARGNWPGLTAEKVEWTDANGQVTGAASNYENVNEFLAAARERRRERFSAHWRHLLHPLTLQHETAEDEGLSISQLVDERIPVMAYIAADPVRALSDGDFERLAFFDTPNGHARPYARDFLDETFSRDCCYDRFWQRKSEEGIDKTAGTAELEWYSTRYLCAGYSFCAVGQSGTWFFDTLVRLHFRRHYYILGVLAILHKAALLGYWQRLAELVSEHSSREKTAEHTEKYNSDVRWLMSDLADFDAQWYFSEVSNQVQAQELFDLWSNRLRTPRLYREVMEQARFMREVQLNQVQEEVADVQTKLNWISTKWLPFLGAAAIFGLELGIPAIEEGIEGMASQFGWPKWSVAAPAAIAFFGIVWWFISFFQKKFLEKHKESK